MQTAVLPATPTPPDPVRAPLIDPAHALSRAGALVAVFVVLAAAVRGSGPGAGWRADAPWILLFGAGAVVGATLAAAVLDRALLAGGLHRELGRGNVAAGITSAAHRIAAALIASRCLYGADLMTLGVGFAFLVLGTLTLLGFQTLHRKLTRYADDQEIRGGNAAAALGNAGLGIALALIVGHAAEGAFTGWVASLRAYGLALLLAFALYPVRQLLVACVILRLPMSFRGRPLDRAIAEQRNLVVGAVEGLGYLATALFVTGLG